MSFAALLADCGGSNWNPSNWTSNVACQAAGSASGKILDQINTTMIQWAQDAMTAVGTAWINFPEPSIVGSDGHSASGAIATAWTDTAWYVWATALIGVLIGVIRMVWENRAQHGLVLLKNLMMILFVQGAVLEIVSLLLTGGTELANWFVNIGAGQDSSTSAETMNEAMKTYAGIIDPSGNPLTSTGDVIVGSILMFLLVALAALMQVIFLIIRSAMLYILLAALPWLAAGAMMRAGEGGFYKAIGWITACVLYKPAAGLIYMMGLLVLSDETQTAQDRPTQIMNVAVGLTILVAAALALPALVRFITPSVAVGVSNAFSGAAGAAAVVATGAAVVTMGASVAPAAAGAAGAAGAGEAAGAASAGGAAESAGSAGALESAGSSSGASSSGAGSGGGVTGEGASEAKSPADGVGKDSDGASSSTSASSAGSSESGGASSGPGGSSNADAASPAPVEAAQGAAVQDNMGAAPQAGLGSSPRSAATPQGASRVVRHVADGANRSGRRSADAVDEMGGGNE